jgi:hypothetical protein
MLRRRTFVLGAIAVFAGCAHDLGKLRFYKAVVESVGAESPIPSEDYSLAHGRQPVTYITLRLLPNTPRDRESHLRVVALGMGESQEFGRPGETVAFAAEGPLLQNGAIPIDQLANYRVVRGNQSGETSNPHHGDNQTVGPARQ